MLYAFTVYGFCCVSLGIFIGLGIAAFYVTDSRRKHG